MRRSDNQILLFVFVSILLHLLFGVLFENRSYWSYKTNRTYSPIEITLQNHPYQIADIEPPAKEEKPKDAKFVGLYDSRVEEERVRPSQPRLLRRSRLAPSPQKSKDEGEKLGMNPPEKRVEQQESQESGDQTLESLPDDFYPDYKIGDRTYLNVLRFPKVSYFVRLKKVFKTTFNPGSAIRSYLYTNKISRGQVEVVLGVTVDKNGGLSELFVINSSNLELYDEEALRTIRDSAPFAAPPSELLDHASTLRMVWTFTVYL